MIVYLETSFLLIKNYLELNPVLQECIDNGFINKLETFNNNFENVKIYFFYIFFRRLYISPSLINKAKFNVNLRCLRTRCFHFNIIIVGIILNVFY